MQDLMSYRIMSSSVLVLYTLGTVFNGKTGYHSLQTTAAASTHPILKNPSTTLLARGPTGGGQTKSCHGVGRMS